MRGLRILIAFAFEVVGIVVLGYVLHTHFDLSDFWTVIVVGVMVLLVLVKMVGQLTNQR